MKKVFSKDGTTIVYDKDGALCCRFGLMPKLAQLLAKHFTVYYYDRRGRGDSAAFLNGETEVKSLSEQKNERCRFQVLSHNYMLSARGICTSDTNEYFHR